MATKRKREDSKSIVRSADTLEALFSSALGNHDSVGIALLHMMEEHDFEWDMLQKILSDKETDPSFADVKYKSIASFVGLGATLQMADIDTFALHRSRVPTTLFRSVVEDIDMVQTHYGPPIVHRTEEARIRFLSPIFNRLVAVFESAFRNLPESLVEGHITTKGWVKYFFEAFGSASLLFVEFKKTGNEKERLDAIAQLITECNACDWNNVRRGFRVPVHGILCDGDVFEFFRFDASTKPPTFQQGCDTTVPRTDFQLPDFRATTPPQFINALRPICEIVFDLMLNAYILSLEAWNTRPAKKKRALESKPQPRLDKWDLAMKSANEALNNFRNAETKRQTGLIGEANAVVPKAMELLQRSIHESSLIHKQALITSGWVDMEVETV